MVGVSYAQDYDLWEDGYFGSVGDLVGGRWLKVLITVAGSVSALGLLNSTMCTTSRALASMATYGYIPRPLARLHPRFGTPYLAVLTNCVCIIALLATGLDFERVAEMSMWLYALTLIFEFLSLVSNRLYRLLLHFARLTIPCMQIILRAKEPELERPFKVPLSQKGLIGMSIPPCVSCVFLIFASRPLTWALCFSILLISFLATIPYKWMKGQPIELQRYNPCFSWKRFKSTRLRHSYGSGYSSPTGVGQVELVSPGNAEDDLVQIDLT